MASRVVLVTGGNGGIGYETALYLARHGSCVIIAARDQQRTASACESIKAATNNSKVIGVQLDLASLDSVHSCALRVRELLVDWQQQLHGLVLNAGTFNNKLEYSQHGVEATFAINHLGHFYLTKLLQPLLAADARIVVTSSGTHDPAMNTMMPHPHWSHPSELALIKSTDGQPHPAIAKYDGYAAYTNSKLCNILFTYHLAKQLQQQGSKVTVVAYNPGYIASTSIMRSMPGWQVWLMAWFVPIMMRLRGIHSLTVEQAGAFQARLAMNTEYQGSSGVYYNLDKQFKSSVESYDEAKQQQLWDYSEELLQQLGAKLSL